MPAALGLLGGFAGAMALAPRVLEALHPAEGHLIRYALIGPVLWVAYRHWCPADRPMLLVEHRTLAVTAFVLLDAAVGVLFWLTTTFWPESPSHLPANWSITHQIEELLAWTVGAAVCEEIVFRGCLQRALQQRHSAAAAIVASSMIFGLLHITSGYGTAGVITTTAGGIGLGVVFAMSGSIWPGIAVHGTRNAMTLLAEPAPFAVWMITWATACYLGWIALRAVKARFTPSQIEAA